MSSPKRLPRVRLQAADARVRRDLAAVLLAANDDAQPQADEVRERKHREDDGQRPPLDQIQRLHDLFTTVPKALGDKLDASGRKKREWRAGYQNNAHGTSRGPFNGLFEPFDAVRNVVCDGRDQHNQQQQQQMSTTAAPIFESIAIAYPVAHTSPAKIAADMQPFDADAAREEMERRTSVRRDRASTADGVHWCPASYSTILDKGEPKRSSSTGTLARDTAGSQPFPVRKVAGVGNVDAPPPRARKTPLVADERCVQKKQSLLAKAAASYVRIRERVDRSKDPKLRYALPVENPSEQRAYRLGLEPVPSSCETAEHSNNSLSIETRTPPGCSSSAASSRERLRFRPCSAAGISVPFRSLSSSSSQSSLNSAGSSLEPAPSVGKVAGAKRRPHSASVCYLGSSTVYCVDAPSSHRSQHLKGNGGKEPFSADFDSVLDRERSKRRCNQNEMFGLLSRRGMLHNLPVPQIFARLRRESLKNLTHRLQCAQYEKMSLEEYMRSCGMLVIVNAERKASSFQLDPSAQVGREEESDGSVDGESSTEEISKFALPTTTTNALPTAFVGATTTSSSLLAMRKMLFVTRQQFHIALEAFSLSPTDVNLLFSALDIDVEDKVTLWEILCAVEKLQDGHAELRRSRVQIKARDLPKDLDQLRKSFCIPNVTHAPLELPEAPDESS